MCLVAMQNVFSCTQDALAGLWDVFGRVKDVLVGVRDVLGHAWDLFSRTQVVFDKWKM